MPVDIGPVNLGGPQGPALNTPFGSWTPFAPSDQQQAATVDPTAHDTALATYVSKHGPVIGQSARTYPPTAADIKAKTLRPTGYTQYTLQDNSTVEIDDNGQVQNYKPAAGSTKNAGWGVPVPVKSTDANGDTVTTYYGTDPSDNTLKPIPGLPQSTTTTASSQTPQQQLARAGGPLLVGSGTTQQSWIKNPTPEDGRGPYIQTDASTAQQQANANKLQADTDYQAAQAKKLQIDNAVAADPTNQALKQQQAQATLDETTARKAAQDATNAKNQWDLQAAQQLQPGKVAQQGVDLQSAQVKLQQAQQDLANNPTDVQLKQAYTQAQTDYEKAQTASIQAKTGEPTMLTTGTGRMEQRWNPATQQIETVQNPNWAPTDPGAMTAQLNQQALDQHNKLNAQVAQGTLSPDQAASQFNDWWDQTIEPQKGDIAAAQAKAQASLQYTQAQTGYEQGLTAMLPADLAQKAADAAQGRAISMMPYMVNASAATTPGITPGPRGFPNVNAQQIMQNATFSLPNLQEIGRQGAAAALANISPTAQMHLQTPGPGAQPPMPGMPDVNSLLNRSAYGFGAPPQVAGAGAPPPPPPPPPSQTSYQIPGLNLGGMPGTGYGGAQSTQLPTTIPGLDLSAMPGYGAGGQSAYLPVPWGQYTPAT